MAVLPGVNRNVPQPASPAADITSLTTVVTSLKQGVESLAGYRGGLLNRAVTYNDLITLGLVTSETATSIGRTGYAAGADLDREAADRKNADAALQSQIDGLGSGGTLSLPVIAAFVFSALPASPVLGQLAVVSDSTAAGWGATVAGGGALKVLAWWSGTAWKVLGA